MRAAPKMEQAPKEKLASKIDKGHILGVLWAVKTKINASRTSYKF